jgi:RNA polymerase subunit RPABC4/transcription elongation factor Spt4
MFEDLFGELETTFSDVVESDAFQAIIYVILAYFVLIWLASAFWAYRDMRLRSASAITPYVAALAIILFTPVFFLFGLLLYRIVRPKETIAEVNERALAEEAMMAEVASHSHCANCERPVHEDWIICPSCRNRLRRVCPNCEHLIELDWTLCAWCGKDFERAETPGTTPFMPSARPAPRPPQPMPAPPPQARPVPPPSAQASPQAAEGSAKPPSQSQRNSTSPNPPTQPQGNAAPPRPSQPSGGNVPPQPPTQPQGGPAPAPRSSGASSSPSSSTSSGSQRPTGI